MALSISVDRNLSEYLDTTTSSFNMATGATKNITLSTGKPYSTNDVLEFRPVGQALPGGIKLTMTSYNSTTGAAVSSATVAGYSDDTPVQICALATGTINTYTNPGLGLAGGEAIRLVRATTVASWGTGTVTTYNNTTGALTLNITAAGTTGTFADMVLVSDGTFNDWSVSYAQTDVINITGTATLTIDSNPVVPISNINAQDRSTLLIKNTSTTNLLKIEFSMYRVDNLTSTSNSKIKVEGDWITIGTGDNTTGQIIDITSYGIPYPMYLEVETGNGTGVYKKWHIVTDGFTGDFRGFNNWIPDYVWGSGDMGNVFFYDPTDFELRVGDGTNGNKIPTGAKVRMPNIYLMGKEPMSYATSTITSSATGNVLGVVDTRLFTSATTVTQILTVNNEAILALGRNSTTSSTITVNTRAQNDTVASAIAPGDKIYRRTGNIINSGLEQANRLNLNSAGTIDFDKVQCYNFLLFGENMALMKLRNVGSNLNFYAINSTGSVDFDNIMFVMTNDAFLGLYLDSVKGDVSVSNFQCTRSLLYSHFQTASVTGNISMPTNTVIRCGNIVKFENSIVIDYGIGQLNKAGSFNFSAISTKDPTYKINNLTAIGSAIYVQNSFNLSLENIYIGLHPTSTHILHTTGATASSTTDEFTIGSTWTNTTTVPPTGSPVRFQSATTYPTAVPALSNGSIRFIIKTSNTTFKIANSYRSAINNLAVDLTSAGSGIRVISEYRPIDYSFQILNGSNIVLNNIFSKGNFASNYLFSIDGACKNIEIYNIDIESCFYLIYIVINNGEYCTIKNAKFGEIIPKAIVSAAGGVNMGMLPTSAIGTNTIIENARSTATGITYDTGVGWGTGYTTSSNFNFITGNKPLHNTSGIAPNMQNVGPYMNLIDQGNSPTTGTLGICAPTPQSTSNITLSGGAYFTNGGSIRFLASGDEAIITNSIPIRGITSFQNATPVHYTSTSPSFTYEFRVKTPTGTFGSWQTLNGTNLAGALSALTGYDSNEGFIMSTKITATLNAGHNYYAGTFATNIDTNWKAPDAYFTMTGVGATEIAEARKVSDDSLVARRQGPGRIDVLAGVEIYFARKSSTGVTIASTVFDPITPVLGNNGTEQLYAGNEIQIADASQVIDDIWNKDISGINTNNAAGKVLRTRLGKTQFLGLK